MIYQFLAWSIAGYIGLGLILSAVRVLIEWVADLTLIYQKTRHAWELREAKQREDLALEREAEAQAEEGAE